MPVRLRAAHFSGGGRAGILDARRVDAQERKMAWRADLGAALLETRSVDLGEEDRHAAGGEVRDVVDGRLPLLGPEARL